jgi:hypothetical protein
MEAEGLALEAGKALAPVVFGAVGVTGLFGIAGGIASATYVSQNPDGTYRCLDVFRGTGDHIVHGLVPPSGQGICTPVIRIGGGFEDATQFGPRLGGMIALVVLVGAVLVIIYKANQRAKARAAMQARARSTTESAP